MKFSFLLVYLMAVATVSVKSFPEPTQTYSRNLRVKRISTAMFNNKSIQLARFCVSIRSKRPEKYFGDNHYCGGALISPKHVLTAAYCAMDKHMIMHRARNLVVVAGTPNRLAKRGSKTVPVKRIFVPTNFTDGNLNNIAIMLLNEILPLTNVNIQYILLPTNAPSYEQTYTVVGWGRMFTGGPLASDILCIEVSLIAANDCRHWWHNFREELMCARGLNGQDANPCSGDSGSPMIGANNTVYGIVSYRTGCGTVSRPSVYTNVWYHLNWITETMKQAAGHYNTNVLILFICPFLAIKITVYMRL